MCRRQRHKQPERYAPFALNFFAKSVRKSKKWLT
jgi:hypothetical protein